MHKAGMIATLFQHLGIDGFVADVVLGDMLDRDPGFSGPRCRRLAHPVAQYHGKFRVVENTDLVGVEEPRHPLGVADGGKRPGHHNPVVTAQDPGYPVSVALFHKRACRGTLNYHGVGCRCYILFGSGSSGLGTWRFRASIFLPVSYPRGATGPRHLHRLAVDKPGWLVCLVAIDFAHIHAQEMIDDLPNPFVQPPVKAALHRRAQREILGSTRDWRTDWALEDGTDNIPQFGLATSARSALTLEGAVQS
jgi:hypothetical protein